MASGVTFPDACLTAILLVVTTRTGSGAQILFHYPTTSSSSSSSASFSTNTAGKIFSSDVDGGGRGSGDDYRSAQRRRRRSGRGPGRSSSSTAAYSRADDDKHSGTTTTTTTTTTATTTATSSSDDDSESDDSTENNRNDFALPDPFSRSSHYTHLGNLSKVKSGIATPAATIATATTATATMTTTMTTTTEDEDGSSAMTIRKDMSPPPPPPAPATAPPSTTTPSASMRKKYQRQPYQPYQPYQPHRHQADHFFGLPEDGLVGLLAPDRTWHKRRFELGINDLTFVGRPVFVRPDGRWRKSGGDRQRERQRQRQRQRQQQPSPLRKKFAGGAVGDDDDTGVSDTMTDDNDEEEEVEAEEENEKDDNDKGEENKKVKHDQGEEESTAIGEKGTTTTTTPSKSKLSSTSAPLTESTTTTTTTAEKSPLTMFHVVFVMNPPPLEHAVRVKDMYDNVIKKFSKALKWEQAHHDYVWKEVELIATTKASRAAERSSPSKLGAEIQAQSSLASAIATVFTAISNSRIAQVILSPKVSFSLQIPPITSISSLPSLTDPPIPPGLWLTTATELSSTGAESESAEPSHTVQLAKHYTLLLKSPPHRIAKDALEAGGQLAAHLPKFVSSLRPTKSFHKLSVTSQISLKDIQVLAHHLIYWRRAVAIPPLHQKDVYIVSPNANLSKLRDATRSFEQQFAQTMPNMPSLPKILSDLSGIPRPFGSLIPSTDHKENYYLALAWLMRNGWVTQLRTFVYIRVDPDVKSAVRGLGKGCGVRDEPNHKSLQNEATAVKDTGRSRARPSLVSRPSSEARRQPHSAQPVHNPRMASIILNPPRALEVESRWLDYIEAMLVKGQHPSLNLSPDDRDELQKYWPLFVKYFDGHVAMETIPVREGLKRRFVWNLLGKVGLDLDSGVEDVGGTNKAILIPVRHW